MSFNKAELMSLLKPMGVIASSGSTPSQRPLHELIILDNCIAAADARRLQRVALSRAPFTSFYRRRRWRGHMACFQCIVVNFRRHPGHLTASSAGFSRRRDDEATAHGWRGRPCFVIDFALILARGDINYGIRASPMASREKFNAAR